MISKLISAICWFLKIEVKLEKSEAAIPRIRTESRILFSVLHPFPAWWISASRKLSSVNGCFPVIRSSTVFLN
mgnify:CR=1 FL=1